MTFILISEIILGSKLYVSKQRSNFELTVYSAREVLSTKERVQKPKRKKKNQTHTIR